MALEHAVDDAIGRMREIRNHMNLMMNEIEAGIHQPKEILDAVAGFQKDLGQMITAYENTRNSLIRLSGALTLNRK